MSFLYPQFLWFLPVLTLPTIIHLFGRNRYRQVKFSSLRFLEELQQDLIQKLKLRQIILLIIRTLLLLFLVLSFARPYRTNRVPGLLLNQGETLYLVVDNSASMAMQVEGEDLLQRELHRILRAPIDVEYPVLLKLVESTQAKFVQDRGLLRDAGQLEQELARITVQARGGSLKTALNSILDDLAVSEETSHCVWIVSDFQKSTWGDLEQSEHPMRRLLQTEGTRTVLFPALPEGRNAAVVRLDIPRQLHEKGKISELQVVLGNWENRAKDVPVSLFLEGERIGQTIVGLEPLESKAVSFQFIPNSGGMLSGYAMIPDDDLPYDNRRFFEINIPELVRVLVVGPQVKDGRFLVKALRLENSSLIDVAFVSPASFALEDCRDYSVLIFSNVDELSAGALHKVEDHMDEGKGVLVFPGEDCEINRYNSLWSENLQLPRWTNSRSAASEAYLKIGSLDELHPLFQGVWRAAGNPANSPLFFTIPEFDLGGENRALMNFSNGLPLIMETQLAQGRALTVATSGSGAWSDLQITGLFPVLLHRMMLYLAGFSLQTSDYQTGDTLQIPAGNGAPLKEPLVLSPSARRYIPTPDEQRKTFIFTRTDEPGIYEFFAAGQKRGRYAVNIDPAEALPGFYNAEQLRKIPGDRPVNLAIYSPGNETGGELLGRSEWSGYLLLLVILMACLEMYIGRINRKSIGRKSIG